MTKCNEDNERIKRKYLVFLKEAKGQDIATVDAVAKALSRFDEYNRYKPFKAFHYEQALGFKRDLMKSKNKKTGKPLSKSTMLSTLRHVKAFIEWLSQESGYKSRIKYSDAEYFSLSEKETRQATAAKRKNIATLDQIKHVMNAMPSTTVIEKRNKAILAFTLLTGARDGAIASFKCKHVDLEAGCVYQDAGQVKTKFSKSFVTYFFPVGDEVKAIFFEWMRYLTNELMFGGDDALFPKTAVGHDGSGDFSCGGLSRNNWATAQPIRDVFKKAFKEAEMPYFNPHSFRDTLAKYGQNICKTPEDFKAWSQNLGHEKVMTTFFAYGEVEECRQAEIFKQLEKPRVEAAPADVAELAKALAKEMTLQAV